MAYMLKIHYGQAETLLNLLQTPVTFVFQKQYYPTFDSRRVTALDQERIHTLVCHVFLPMSN